MTDHLNQTKDTPFFMANERQQFLIEGASLCELR